MASQWILARQEGFETSLEYQKNVKVPRAEELGSNEVLVKLHAASLNAREINIADPKGINGPITPPVVPGCDGAGVVVSAGSSVQEFKSGDRVITFTAPETVEKRGDDAFASVMELFSMLGQGADGTLRSFGVFSEKALVHAPASLDWLPAATLTCNWSTAWNCLFGLEGKTAGPGKWILVQGTGGVAVAVLQVAVAAGAVVVATTSTEEKEARLKKLGASHTINYRSSPDDWEQKARSLTPEGRGFDIVVDVGGNETLGKSLAAVRVDGLVLVIGGVGISAAPVPLFSILLHNCVARGMLGGSRAQLKEAVRFIDEKGIKPAVDDVVFELEDALDAYKRLHSRKHFAKVVIRISHAED